MQLFFLDYAILKVILLYSIHGVTNLCLSTKKLPIKSKNTLGFQS
ncbi:hypothetical protein BTH160X_260002 [Brochothrix thermosphacta]|uniref:Uncharacterized protein n=1 Tax=Brochothrix thermosphacta TaxID=2756 RepID=A0A2X0RZE9_BROTH|nr:hypothetical protein BTH160X_260002 [Brochothrix thermosphacta]SPP25626.1 hypothetical protein BTBSAS_10084 [Brochothrix thermosphacta]